MTAVGDKRQAERNRRYALLLVEAKLLGIRLDDSRKKVRARWYDVTDLSTIIARKRAQK